MIAYYIYNASETSVEITGEPISVVENLNLEDLEDLQVSTGYCEPVLTLLADTLFPDPVGLIVGADRDSSDSLALTLSLYARLILRFTWTWIETKPKKYSGRTWK